MKTNQGKTFRNGMRPVHPGEVLKEEFLEPLEMTANKLAEALHVTLARLYEIISGRRGVTANTAIRLSIALGTTPEFWMNLQTIHDLRMQEIAVGEDIFEEVHPLPELEAETA